MLLALLKESILSAALILSVVAVVISLKSSKLKYALQALLLFLIFFTGYQLFTNIEKPIRFQEAREDRYRVVIEKLKQIRQIQEAYEDAHGVFANNFDELFRFVREDSLILVKAIGNVPDSLTEAQAVELGIVIRDSSLVAVKDSMFGPPFPLDDLRYIPFSDNKEFLLASDSLESTSGVTIQVFEVKAPNTYFLRNLGIAGIPDGSEEEYQYVVNYNDELVAFGEYHGLKVGSLTEATNNSGNWDKKFDVEAQQAQGEEGQ